MQLGPNSLGPDPPAPLVSGQPKVQPLVSVQPDEPGMVATSDAVCVDEGSLFSEYEGRGVVDLVCGGGGWRRSLAGAGDW